MKTAIVIGATGLVGSALVQLLLEDNQFSTVKIFVRHATGIKSHKLEEYVVNFDQPDKWQQRITGDVLFSCMGTTRSQSRNKDERYKVEYTYQFNTALAAATNGVPVYVLVSSVGANDQSAYFYLRTKGALETAVLALPFAHTHILRPGPLAGVRKKKRPGEQLFVKTLGALNAVGLLKKYLPVAARNVARSMIRVSLDEQVRVKVYESKDCCG